MCVPSTTVEGDGLDNDCDGKIDEELCTPANGGAGEDIIHFSQSIHFCIYLNIYLFIYIF